jgi:hypothetical protein
MGKGVNYMTRQEAEARVEELRRLAAERFPDVGPGWDWLEGLFNKEFNEYWLCQEVIEGNSDCPMCCQDVPEEMDSCPGCGYGFQTR